MDIADVRDTLTSPQILQSERVYRGAIWDIRSETVDLGAAGQVRREFVQHTGAVAVLALNEQEEVLLLRQYRHPVQSFLWELPAGLLDLPGESWVEAAGRELGEEADLVARDWDTLIDYYSSPGGSDEFMRIFLARNLSQVPLSERHVRQEEEADLVPVWVPLREAVNKVLAGELHNPSTALGLLAAQAGQLTGWAHLRAPDAPFEIKPR